MEKTLVTNIKRKPIHFLGFTYKVTRGGTAMRGYKPVVKPQADRLNRKMEEVLKDISFLQRSMDKAESVDRINRINATNVRKSEDSSTTTVLPTMSIWKWHAMG